MTTLNESNVADRRTTVADAVRVLNYPDDVLSHPDLTTTEKREILAAWASDAHAVVDAPGLRQLHSGSVVNVDKIFRALRRLDAPDAGGTSNSPPLRPQRRRRSLIPKLTVSLRRKDDDDDDDPPPSPIAAFPPDLASVRRRMWELSANDDLIAA